MWACGQVVSFIVFINESCKITIVKGPGARAAWGDRGHDRAYGSRYEAVPVLVGLGGRNPGGGPYSLPSTGEIKKKFKHIKARHH